ncbi:MAG: hypothetical protein JJT93_11005 [Gammaproteobacteria bacterium]|nr:hypothetical protein [Gammaproteobacteria bacterium]
MTIARLLILGLGLLALGGPALPTAVAETFDEDSFERFASMRAGEGEPVYWYTIGTVFRYPDGEALFRMEGVDTARRLPDDDDGVVHQASRKVFFYRDIDSNALLHSYNGRPVEPIAYPYQYITYALDRGTVVTYVEQGTGPSLQRIGPVENITLRRIGETLVFSAPLFLDFPIGDGRRYQAFENYDFFVHPETARLSLPNQLSWVRYGDLPPFAGPGQGIIHLVSWRVDDYAALPSSMREALESEAPLWMAPPASLEEIRELQQR